VCFAYQCLLEVMTPADHCVSSGRSRLAGVDDLVVDITDTPGLSTLNNPGNGSYEMGEALCSLAVTL